MSPVQSRKTIAIHRHHKRVHRVPAGGGDDPTDEASVVSTARASAARPGTGPAVAAARGPASSDVLSAVGGRSGPGPGAGVCGVIRLQGGDTGISEWGCGDDRGSVVIMTKPEIVFWLSRTLTMLASLERQAGCGGSENVVIHPGGLR
jgi:hypothetical protein